MYVTEGKKSYDPLWSRTKSVANYLSCSLNHEVTKWLRKITMMITNGLNRRLEFKRSTWKSQNYQQHRSLLQLLCTSSYTPRFTPPKMWGKVRSPSKALHLQVIKKTSEKLLIPFPRSKYWSNCEQSKAGRLQIKFCLMRHTACKLNFYQWSKPLAN